MTTGQCEDLICGLAATRIRGRMYKLLPGRLSRRVNTKETRKGDGEVKGSVGRRDGDLWEWVGRVWEEIRKGMGVLGEDRSSKGRGMRRNG